MTMLFRRFPLMILALAVMLIAASAGHAQQPATIAQARVVDEHTQLLLVVDDAGKPVDLAGNAAITSSGVEIIDDATFGKALSLGNEANNHITLRQLGKLNFEQGFTIEGWVRLKRDGDKKNEGGGFALKIGSFAMGLSKKNSLDISWIVFPTSPVATTTDKQYKYYPVGSDGFGGMIDIPEERWAHLAVTYDPTLAVIRTWVNGSLDRERYIARSYYAQHDAIALQNIASNPLMLFRNLKNADVASVRISGVARNFGRVEPLQAYVYQLPYAGQTAVLVTRIDPNLPFPLDAYIVWESPTGGTQTIERFTLENASDKLVRFKPPGWNNDYYTLTVRVNKDAHELYQRSTQVTNGQIPRNSRHRIDSNNVLSIDGQKVFPLMLYHVFPEDFQAAADMGFNIVTPRAPMPSAFMGLGIRGDKNMKDIEAVLDATAKAKVQLTVPNRIGGSEVTVRFADHASLVGWYSYDEPWGYKLSKVITSYNMLKLTHPGVPVMVAQNNFTRLHETAEGVDILLPDPYPIPNVSLRMVADTTKESILATAGLKPVWTVVCQYGSKQPDAQELRSMIYLALTAGANGIGIYAWDDRMPDRTTKELKGWYTKESPADLAVLRQVMGEITKLTHVFLVPNAADAVKKLDSNPAVHASIKVVDGKRYLLLASDSRQPEQVNLEIAQMTSGTARRVSSDGKNLEIRDGKLSHTLEPLDAATYVIE